MWIRITGVRSVVQEKSGRGNWMVMQYCVRQTSYSVRDQRLLPRYALIVV